MRGLFTKKFTTVVMDSSNEDHVEAIIAIVRMMTGSKSEVTCRELDCDHPTMKVVEYYTTRRRAKDIQDVLNEVFPNLCVFNVKV